MSKVAIDLVPLYESVGILPERRADLHRLVDHYRVGGRVPRDILQALEDKLNAERPGAGTWQLVQVGSEIRHILRLHKPVRRE